MRAPNLADENDEVISAGVSVSLRYQVGCRWGKQREREEMNLVVFMLRYERTIHAASAGSVFICRGPMGAARQCKRDLTACC